MPISIRASSLSTFLDCQRRWAANALPDLVRAAGFELRQVGRAVGGIIGTAMHAGMKHALTPVVDGGGMTKHSEVRDFAQAALSDGLADVGAVIYDQSTGTASDAQLQVEAGTRILYGQVYGRLRPTALERELKAEHPTGGLVTGHPDVDEPEDIYDLKGGRRQAANGVQYGAYNLLRRSMGDDPKRITEIFQQRVPIRQLHNPPAPVLIPYDVGEAEALARQTIDQAMAAALTFEGQGQPLAFLPNPGSMLCSDKYCPAWGTAFCRAHKGGPA